MQRFRNSMISLFIVFFVMGQLLVYADGKDKITIIVGDSRNTSIFKELIAQTNLDMMLQEDGPYTVFIPSDEAFNAWMDHLDITKDELLNQPDLSRLLRYHMISNKIYTLTDQREQLETPTMNMQNVILDISEGVFVNNLGEKVDSEGKEIIGSGISVNNANVVQADIYASNGIIHVIDQVLVPTNFTLEKEKVHAFGKPYPEKADYDGNMIDVIIGDGEMKILLQALTQTGIRKNLEDEEPYTLFAPTDKVFEEFLHDYQITEEELLAHPDLYELIAYHLILGNVYADDLTDGLAYRTMSKENMIFNVSYGIRIDGAKVVTNDIQTKNGVIHLIDQVLLPENVDFHKKQINEKEEVSAEIEESSQKKDVKEPIIKKDNETSLIINTEKDSVVFNDVQLNDWYYLPITQAVENGLIKGYPDHTFRPNQPANRAEVASIIQNVYQYQGTSPLPFDVDREDWFSSSIASTIYNGIFSGYEDGSFRPFQQMTRAEFFVSWLNTLSIEPLEEEETNKILASFIDQSSIPLWARGYFASLIKSGIVTGDHQMIKPNEWISRAEVAAIMINSFKE